MPNIALIDWDWFGHVPLFSGSIARVFTQHGWQVQHHCRDPEKSSIWFAQELGLEVSCRGLCPPAMGSAPSRSTSSVFRRRSLSNARQRWASVDQTMRQSQNRQCDFVFFPWLDGFLDHGIGPADVPRSLADRWGAMVLNVGHFSSPASGFLRRRRHGKKFGALDHKGFRLLATLDELAVPALQRRFGDTPIRAMPDFVEPQFHCAETTDAMNRAKATGSRVMVSVGVMQKRKGFLKLLKLARRGGLAGWQVVLSGRVDWNGLKDDDAALVRDAIAGRYDGVHVHEGHLATDAHINAEIAAADVVFLGYEQWKQSSNIMTRAAKLGRPVLTCSEGVLAHRTRSNGLGWVLPDDGEDSIELMLGQITEDALVAQSRQNGYAPFALQHDVSTLQETFKPILRPANLGAHRQAA